MPFTYAQAISRINGNPAPVWKPGMSDAQKLQRLNEILDLFYTMGTWDGLEEDVTVVSVDGIITLDPRYRALTALTVPEWGANVSIKQQRWKYSPSAPTPQDWTKWGGEIMAFDLGDSGNFTYTNTIRDAVTGLFYDIVINNGIEGLLPNTSATTQAVYGFQIDGVTGRLYKIVVNNGIYGIDPTSIILPLGTGNARQYQVTGNPDTLDALTFTGSAQRRYTWVTDTSTIINPDCYSAIDQGVRAFHWKDAGDDQRFQSDFAKAIATLERDLGSVLENEDLGRVTLEYWTSGGSLMNIP